MCWRVEWRHVNNKHIYTLLHISVTYLFSKNIEYIEFLNLTKNLLEKKSNLSKLIPIALKLYFLSVLQMLWVGFVPLFSFSKSLSARAGLSLVFECWLWATERLHGTPW